MKIKLFYIALIISANFLVVLLNSCGTRVTKAEDAFDLVKKERMLSDDSSFVSKETIQASMKTELVKKVEKPDEWTQFRLEMEKKIKLNEVAIKKIKDKSELKNNTRRKLAFLEKENSELRVKMDEYAEDIKVRWETFKSSQNHIVNKVGIDLNALKTEE